MSYSKGISWIDDCRIPFVDEGDKSIGIITKEKQNIFGGGKGFIRGEYQLNNQGRFPANILVSDDMLNDGIIAKSSKRKADDKHPPYKPKKGWNNNNLSGTTGGGYTDKGTNSRYYDIDKWFDKILND